jgi:hypothetical protein
MLIRVPSVKKLLWGGKFLLKGCSIGMVEVHGGENVIEEYVRKEGNGEYWRFMIDFWFSSNVS